jgi:hypothetical protein
LFCEKFIVDDGFEKTKAQNKKNENELARFDFK